MFDAETEQVIATLAAETARRFRESRFDSYLFIERGNQLHWLPWLLEEFAEEVCEAHKQRIALAGINGRQVLLAAREMVPDWEIIGEQRKLDAEMRNQPPVLA